MEELKTEIREDNTKVSDNGEVNIISLQDDLGLTALHCAVQTSRETIAKMLLEVMSEDDICKVTKEDAYTALHLALTLTDEEYNFTIVEFLLTKCPKLATLKDRHGQTPLHWAASKGHVDAVVKLLDILPSEEISVKCPKGNTAFIYAKTEEIRCLIDLGSAEDYL